MRSYRIFSLFLTVWCSVQIWAVEYEIVGDHEQFIEPCSKDDDKGNVKMSDYLDMSSVKRVYSDELDFVYFTGNVVVKKSLPQGYPIRVATDALYWTGNQWMNTVVSIRRTDLCKDLFDPSEFWYDFMNQLTEEQRVCPPQEGTIFSVENVPNRMQMNLPLLNVPNQIKVLSHLSVANYTICVTIFAHFYKI